MSKEYLTEVSKEIINMKIEPGKSIKTHFNKFYEIMRKYNIKQGTATDNGVARKNYEWTICWKLFMTIFVDQMELLDMFSDITPKDLEC